MADGGTTLDQEIEDLLDQERSRRPRASASRR